MKVSRDTAILLPFVLAPALVWDAAAGAGNGPGGPATPTVLQHPQEHQGAALQFKGEPRDLGDDAPRVGELIADLDFIGVDGRSGRLGDLVGERGLVVVIRDVFCPVSRRYGARLARIEDEYRERGFGFLYLDVNEADTPDDVGDEITAHGFDAPYVLQADSPIAHELDAMTSTEVFVLDASRTLRYRGAVDDQYGIGFTKPTARKRYLIDALEAVATGAEPEVKGTIAPGCYLSLGGSLSSTYRSP